MTLVTDNARRERGTGRIGLPWPYTARVTACQAAAVHCTFVGPQRTFTAAGTMYGRSETIPFCSIVLRKCRLAIDSNFVSGFPILPASTASTIACLENAKVSPVLEGIEHAPGLTMGGAGGFRGSMRCTSASTGTAGPTLRETAPLVSTVRLVVQLV